MDFWYENTMSAACGDKDDSEFTNISAIAATDMVASAFKDTLNAAIEGEGLTAWTQAANKNSGYPRLESSVAVERTVTSSSGRASISGRIHPDAKVVFMKLTDGDPEYLSLLEWLKKDGIKEGWKVALVYDDGMTAVWEGDLTIQIKPENIDEIKDLALVYYDINGEHTFPNVKIEGDTLIIKVNDMGSFAIADASDVKDQPDSSPSGGNDSTGGGSPSGGNDSIGGGTSSGDNNSGNNNISDGTNTGDSAIILPYIILMTAAVFVLLGAVVLFIKKSGAKRG